MKYMKYAYFSIGYKYFGEMRLEKRIPQEIDEDDRGFFFFFPAYFIHRGGGDSWLNGKCEVGRDYFDFL